MFRTHRLALAALLLLVALSGGQGAPAPVSCAANSQTVPPYAVFELTFEQAATYPNPFLDVQIDVAFTAPSGKQMAVGGFFYGTRTEGGQTTTLWKARLAPDETGEWRYEYTLTGTQAPSATVGGSFRCVRDRVTRHGFVRQDAASPLRWAFDDGTPYHPIGLQDMVGLREGTTSVLPSMSLEGPFRGRPGLQLPPGAMFQPGPAMNPVNADVYFRRYGQCGFNFFRHPGHNAPSFGSPDHPNAVNCAATDELLDCVRRYGFRIQLCFFGWDGAWKIAPDNVEGMAKTKRFAKYLVDRWGAMVDFWEFYNEENNVPPAWFEAMVPYVKSIDPYHHPITNSHYRQVVTNLDFESPHYYSGVAVERADTELLGRGKGWQEHGKPIIVGEAGNSAPMDFKVRAPGNGGVWDPDSALRMRVRTWAGLFNGISFVFWNTSYAKDGHFMNQWLGPREREYVRSLQGFAAGLGGGQREVPPPANLPAGVRAYALASGRTAALYLFHPKEHATPVQGLALEIDVPRAGKAYWYDPATAAILQTLDVTPGKRQFTAPDFAIDLALLITPDGPPDVDGDGIANDRDPDNDNDGVPNAKDAFPLDPSEWGDRDGDLIGDFMDADDDPADGTGDDKNKNGIPDFQEDDLDGDRLPMAKALPYDVFPWDAKEWADLDGDGIGDNSDPDVDGDGFTNAEEKQAGTDPRNPLSFPTR